MTYRPVVFHPGVEDDLAPMKRFPYMAVHVVRDDRIDVLAVIGVRRDPASIEVTVSGRRDE